MQALGPGTFGEIFDDAARERPHDADRIHPLLVRQAQRGRHTGGGAERSEHRGRMETGLVNAHGSDEARAAHELDAYRDAGERVHALQLVSFRHRQYGRHDHRTGVHRAAFERVVEILAVRGRAVDERGAGRVERARMGDCGTAACALPACDGRAYVVRPARGDAKTGHVYHELLRRLAEIGRRRARALNARGELLGNGGIRSQARNYFSNGGARSATTKPSPTPIASATMSRTSKVR